MKVYLVCRCKVCEGLHNGIDDKEMAALLRGPNWWDTYNGSVDD